MVDAAPPENESESFRRVARDHARLDSLDLYSRTVALGSGLAISSAQRIDDALASIRGDLLSTTMQESTLHGWRVQALFEAIVASLGKVRLLKFEDAGDIFISGPALRPPDFRIITADGRQLLVEVKGFSHASPNAEFRIRTRDIDELRIYAEAVGVPELMLAVYWVRWNWWTLTPVACFRPDGPRHLALSFPEAIVANEMNAVGDRTIGTEWPLTLTVLSDPTQPRTVDETGKASFKIGRVEHAVAGRIVEAPEEQAIMHRLMLHGGWEETAIANTVDNELVAMSFEFAPSPPPERGEFALHRPLSSVFSSLFKEATTDSEGEITDLRIDIDPGALASLVPDDYQGDALRIWRFEISPSTRNAASK